MQEYKVVLVDDDDLPRGVDWAVARLCDGGMIAFLKRTRMLDTEMLEDAWAAAAECEHPPQRAFVA